VTNHPPTLTSPHIDFCFCWQARQGLERTFPLCLIGPLFSMQTLQAVAAGGDSYRSRSRLWPDSSADKVAVSGARIRKWGGRPVVVEFNAVHQEHSNYRHQVLLSSGSRPLSQAKLWCSAALRFRGAKARLRNLTHPLNLPLPSG